MSNSDTPVTARLKEASKGLMWMSESESGFEEFEWSSDSQTLTPDKVLQLTNHAPDTPIQEIELDDFFALATQEQDWYESEEKQTAQRYRHLVDTLKSTLEDIRVYRVGNRAIDIYIIGRTSEGKLAGLSTKVVET